MSAKAGSAPISDPYRRVRRHPRYTCNFPVTVTLFAGDSYRRLDAHCKNLSEAGMGILLAQGLAISEVVSLKFSFPESPQEWELRAVLRHRRGYHYGLEFISVTTELSRAIRRFTKGLEISE
jgi:c-di-GMP-binding flagellar brake protein YcgR